VSSQDRIVRLDNRSGHLRCRVDTELQLALLAIVDREALHEQCTKARACSTTKRVKHQETLQTRAVVCNMTNFVQDLVNQLFPNGIMTACVVVGRILLASDHLLGME